MSSYRRRLMLANQSEENIIFYGNSVQDGTPAPDAPIDIMSLDNPTIKVTGKNLFNNDTSLIKVVTYKASDDASETKRNGYEIKLQPGTYTIKARYKAEAKTGYIYGVVADKNNVRKQTVNSVQGTYLPAQIVFNIESGDTFKIYDGIGENSVTQSQNNFNKFNIQIESGTIATEYEPYEEELITIDETTPFGKNLIPNTYKTKTTETFTFTPTEEGKILVNGTGNGSSISTIDLISSTQNLNNYLIDGETYSFCINTDTNITNVSKCIICIYAKRKDTGEQTWFLGAWGNKINKITVDKSLYDYIKLYIQINPTTATFEDLVVSPIMARGSYTELPFEPYVPPITSMCGVGNYKDRIYTKDGKVWFEQRSWCYKTSLCQNVYQNKITSIGLHLYTDDNIVDKKYRSLGRTATIEENNPGLSTHFTYNEKAYSAWGLSDVTVMIGARLWFLSDNFATESEAQLWFNENQIEVIYPLLNPIITEITGSLAEKILAIDKSKNITIYSDNGVYGNTEVTE